MHDPHGPYRRQVARLRRRPPEVHEVAVDVRRWPPARDEAIAQPGAIDGAGHAATAFGMEVGDGLPGGHEVVLEGLRAVLDRTKPVFIYI